MNDTKWNELFRGIQEGWLGWCYRQKSILEIDFDVLSSPPKGRERDWWFGFWNLEIEIMDIHPFTYAPPGQPVNQTCDLEALLREVGIPFESHTDFVRIPGYAKLGETKRSEQDAAVKIHFMRQR